MANYIYNYWKFGNKSDYEKALSLIPIEGHNSLDFRILCSKSNHAKDLLKEILDAGLDNEDLDFYCEHYDVSSVWDKIYIGTSCTFDFEKDDINLIIKFTSNWTPPIGAVQKLIGMKLDLKAYYVGEFEDDEVYKIVYVPQTATVEIEETDEINKSDFE